MTDYHPGGYIPPGLATVTIGVAECIISAADLSARRLRCSRTDSAHLKAAHPDWTPDEEAT